MGTRTAVNQLTVLGPLTLDDLRWLVEASRGLDGASRVEVAEAKGHVARDYDPAKFTVHGRSETGPPGR